ncbi:SsrA-binding protein [Candidatus Legionella polyplacis]|uniref:SsrA-binding protein SmpB n=1 Tax=Candidatus Legionella polyplacis TaxID=2005262 RepID=UPI000C1E11BD|nr:SsrA-binding protein SmpB [Candidatus Legionella polyplacis]ATW01811.1 SsrA-binding protein [Candidatus Legionella polyplacis]
MHTHKKNLYSIIVSNKKAYFDYYIENTYNAGIILKGWEVKSIRINSINLINSIILIKNKEIFLLNTHIQPIQNITKNFYIETKRARKLLLKYKEIKKLIGSIKQKGYTLIPLEFYWKNNLIKVKISLAKGKKKYDKRNTLKNREWNKYQQKTLKKYLKTY